MRDRLRPALALAGVLLLGFTVAWQLRLSRPWTQRIPPGWAVEYDYIGTQTFAAPGAASLPLADELGRYERRQHVEDDRGRPRQIVVEDSYLVRKIDSDTVVFEYVTHERVDPVTGAHVTPGLKGDILLFPRDVEQRTYSLRSNYIKGIPLAFESTDDIEGLETYVFSYAGPAEYTEAYAGTPSVPGIPVKKGQEIRCVDDGFRYRVWVEPATGAVTKVEESCTSGDFVIDVATGKRLYPVDRWSGVTTGRALFTRTEQVRSMRARYLFASRDLPLALAIGGLLLLGVAVAPRPGVKAA